MTYLYEIIILWHNLHRHLRVGDGDGFRIYHTPGPFYSYPFKFRNVPETPKGEPTCHV